jgi:hypothetical protein
VVAAVAAAAAQLTELEAEGRASELAGALLVLARLEGPAMDAALAALQERALPKLASLMDELAKAAAM